MFARRRGDGGRRGRAVPGGLVVLAFAGGGPGRPWLVPLVLSLAVIGCLAVGLRRTPRAGFDSATVALTLLGVCYCAWLLSHAIWLRDLPRGAGLTFLALGVTWCGETAAYFVGRRWGRRKLAPRVSPAKTVEGGVAQLVASVAAALLAQPWVAGEPAPRAAASASCWACWARSATWRSRS